MDAITATRRLVARGYMVRGHVDGTLVVAVEHLDTLHFRDAIRCDVRSEVPGAQLGEAREYRIGPRILRTFVRMALGSAK